MKWIAFFHATGEGYFYYCGMKNGRPMWLRDQSRAERYHNEKNARDRAKLPINCASGYMEVANLAERPSD
jgi:hypothetical protein